ncbi:D-alanyl-lipoteichoic acid biosynthesis protein DltD [Desulfosporosinus sp. SB140]|uniref:D-alanyl-lipoteichoic acid biosynthesis protein DltD n=1 Tax=Desulfosporosinus paludis TaxID=3115649 RepID=UPI0038901427
MPANCLEDKKNIHLLLTYVSDLLEKGRIKVSNSKVDAVELGILINQATDGFMNIINLITMNDNIREESEKVAYDFVILIETSNERRPLLDVYLKLLSSFKRFALLLLEDYKFNLAIYGFSNLSNYFEEVLDTQKARVVLYTDKKCSKKNTAPNLKRVLEINNVNHELYDYLIICINVPEDQLEILGVDKNKIINLWKLLEEYLSVYMKIYFLNYNYNQLNSGIRKANGDFSYELFITGLSYPMKGINEYLLPKKSVKLTSSSQDLYYDYLLAKKLLSTSHNFKYCILGLAYYSFSFDVAKTSDAPRIENTFYPIIQDSHGYIISNDYQPPIGIERISEIVSFNNPIINVELLNKCLENVFGVNIDSPIDEKGWNSPCENLPIKQLGYKRALFHSKFNYKATIDEYKDIFKKYLDLLKHHNVLPIIVIFPTSSYYYDYFNEDIRNNFYNIINEFRCSYKFQFFDFFYSKLFAPEDFADCDHLNQRGADKMTKILSKVIYWA